MKRVLLAILVLFLVCFSVYSQQAAEQTDERPTSSQTKQSAQQYASQARMTASQFAAAQADINARNVSNQDASAFNKLKSDIDKLEASIREEQNKIAASLEKGLKVNKEALDRVQKLIDQHKDKLTELESFTSS